MIPQATERRPERQFGFVHFAEQKSADKAVDDALKGNKPELLGSALEVKPFMCLKPFACIDPSVCCIGKD